MGMKGMGYQKTQWTYQERPVASSKLNGWDDNVETALELVHEMLALAWGGGDGVVRGAASSDLDVVATSPASLTVTVSAGRAFISKFVYKLGSDTNTSSVTAPSSQPRIDLVVARLNDCFRLEMDDFRAALWSAPFVPSKEQNHSPGGGGLAALSRSLARTCMSSAIRRFEDGP